jgi:hypothetical protein
LGGQNPLKALPIMGLLTNLWDFRVVCLNAPDM